MHRARVWVAGAIVACAIVAGTRIAQSSCEDGLTEDGCKQYPKCQCTYEVIPCPKGGWYYKYYVLRDEKLCPDAPPTPVPSGSGSGSGGSGSGSGPGSGAPKTPCDRMRDWLDAEKNFVENYLREDLRELGIAHAWSFDMYQWIVWRASRPTTLPPAGGIGLMWTDSKCHVRNYAAGCDWLTRVKLLPHVACDIALAHEHVHVDQCHAHGPPRDLEDLADRELEAHRKQVSDIQKYLDDNCK